ncbi:hypothetical protein A3H38_03320 [candidate division WOR-1 bacterium RIFCSPLOWO2_02_FULL_46_20]|uniref:Type 4 fimbrial biogenesis protein PilX N-terminal domain-containing protein n=2 Tax=Saganbacteria TaxID=1703751 RepID=A0A1F4RGA0_UNCSA|nr:MAG: hypothetical protein A3H38_03320 [candidate division WOR-1 bacterium RIFCSPLOWO2_02_FULL_46_20]OGC09999.1 MAG: hypothetical protein A3F86_03720 [candidate division WOR-1 bacterium RIFCSPLOWO2_12_FULL_45_9]
MKNRNGFGLLTIVFIILVFSVLAIGLVSFMVSETNVTVKEYHYTKAFHVAQAGQNFAAQHLAAYPDWIVDMGLPLARSFAGGTFAISSTQESGDQITIVSVGLVTREGKTYSSTISAAYSISAGSGLTHNFDYALYSGPAGGGATLRIQGSAQIFGDFYYNGPIRLGGSASQQGGTIYSTSLVLDGTATYDSWEAATPVDMPIWDNTSYEAILATSTQSASSTLALGWGNVLNLAGGVHIYRDITIGWGATVNGPGTLVATGNPSGNGDINLNYGAGIGAGVRFVAERDFTYSGGSNLTIPIEVYVKRNLIVTNNLTVPSGSILYSKGTGARAIETGGTINASMLVPYGGLYMNYGTLRGLIYSSSLRTANSGEIRGAMVCYSPSTIQGSLQIYYDAAYLPDSIVGLGGTGSVEGEAGIAVGNWQEVY